MSDPNANPSDGGHPAAVASAGFLLFAACVWIVHQGGLLAAEPGAALSLVGLMVIVAEALPLLAAWWLGAAGYGYLLRQRGVAQAGVGMAVLLMLNYIAGFVVGFSGWMAWGLCLVGIGLLNVQLWRLRRGAVSQGANGWRLADRRVSWWWLLGVPGLALLIVAACCPPGTIWRIEALGYDVLSYHLQIPREWLAAGRMVELEHNVYGYLPGLMEAAFAALMSMRGGAGAGGVFGAFAGSRSSGVSGGSVIESVYVCQLFHASFAVLAAAAVASLLRGVVTRAAAVAGGAWLLLVPWVIVTGSMAYNEMVVVALAAVGLRLVAGREKPCGRMGVAIGLLAGAATLAKLTAAFTVALPLGGVLVWRLLKDRPWREAMGPVVMCGVVGCAALSPYLARNAAWTGNPVFPFAGSVLGQGHWDETRAARWDAAHMPDEPWGERISAAWRQAVGNTGYGAWGGRDTPSESNNIARFAQEGGLPVLWLAAAAGLACGWTRRETRWLSAVLGVMLLGQVVWWLSMTHLQSRFLVVCILPLCVGAGLLFDRRGPLKFGGRFNVGAWIAVIVGVVLASVALTTTWSQTTRLVTADGQRLQAPLWLIVDGLPMPHGMDALQDLPVNGLPSSSKVMVVGNNQSLFYVGRPMVYASAFDASPITAMLRLAERATDRPPGEDLARRLRADGVTHLWLGYSELDRLHATYGFDAGVTSDKLRQLVADWRHLTDPSGPTVLVEVPRR